MIEGSGTDNIGRPAKPDIGKGKGSKIQKIKTKVVKAVKPKCIPVRS